MSVLQAEFGFTPLGLWNIMELVILAVFFIQFLFFFFKFRKEKKEGAMESVCRFDLAYAGFFFAIMINQFIYIGDTVSDLMPRFDFFISNGDILMFLGSIQISLSNQILLMVVLLLYALFPAMYPIEKYLKNKPKTPVYRMAFVVSIITTILYLGIFVIGRGLAVPDGFNGKNIAFAGEGDTIFGQVMNIVFLIISLMTLVVALLLISNFILFYLVLAIKTTGPLRTKALIIFLGFLLFYGALIIGNGLRNRFDDPDEILGGWLILGGPIVFLIGNIMLVLGFNKKVLD